jgi:NAD(P)-dependent dehydrogenase (short-subunit alcohol dehydrogenase family)
VRELHDRIAVITGGGSGIGRAIALTAAARGMHVAVLDVELAAAEKVAAEVRDQGRRSLAIGCDVSDRAAVEAAAERSYAEFGACHLLCNNAGVLVLGPLDERSDDDWRWALGVNLFGVIHGIQAFVPRMRDQGGEAHIVNTASMAGLSALPSLGVYTTTKYAVVGLSESLRIDLAPHGIGVSVLCPGGVATRIVESDRNRPAELGRGGIGEADRQRVATASNESVADMIDPAIVGRAVIDAVCENRLWILTHPHWKAGVEQRFDSILKAFDEAAGSE